MLNLAIGVRIITTFNCVLKNNRLLLIRPPSSESSLISYWAGLAFSIRSEHALNSEKVKLSGL